MCYGQLMEVAMLFVVLVTVLRLAGHLLPQAVSLLPGMETGAAILALSVFVFVPYRVWVGANRRRQEGILHPRCPNWIAEYM